LEAALERCLFCAEDGPVFFVKKLEKMKKNVCKFFVTMVYYMGIPEKNQKM